MIKLDVSLQYHDDLRTIPDLARRIESSGFDGLWTAEVNHDPFLQLGQAAGSTQRISVGTAIALSFTRSPMTLAYTCWDLANFSDGRFILGMGTQVKAHNEKRFSTKWEAPVPRLREVIEGLRAIWHSWRTGERLNFRGEHYQFTLMTPFFTPPRHSFEIPIFIAGINERLCQLAGAVADGFHVHPLHSVKYLREFVIPHILTGAHEEDRGLDDMALSASVFVITGEDPAQRDTVREDVRQQISFYASTPSYRTILEMHGWEATGEQLSRLAARKKWDEMPSLISDEMLDTFAISGPPETIGDQAIARYAGLLNRITFYLPYDPQAMPTLWHSAVHAFQQQKPAQ